MKKIAGTKRSVENKARLSRIRKQISDSQFSELTFPTGCHVHDEASQLACKLAIRTTTNDQACKVSRIWKSQTLLRNSNHLSGVFDTV